MGYHSNARGRILGIAMGFAAMGLAAVAPAVRADEAAAGIARFDRAYHHARLANGLDMAYVELGDPKGRPILLVHGYTDTAIDWVPLAPWLDPKRRLIAVDLRGHGASGKPECCYTRQDFAYDLKLLLDRLHIERTDVIAVSLGSIILQSFVELWPERVDHVVLIGSTGGRKPAADGAPQGELTDFEAQIRKLKDPIDPDSPFMMAWWASPTPVDPAVNRRQRVDSAKIPVRVWLAILNEAMPDYAEYQRTLKHFSAPALLIWGSRDPIMTEDVRESLRQALPAAQVKVYEGLGHVPFWEQPRLVAADINAFLSGS